MTSPLLQELRDFDRSKVTLVPVATSEPLLFYDDRWLRAWAQAFLPAHGWARPLTVYSVEAGGDSLGFIAFARQAAFHLPTRSLAGYYWPFRTLAVRDDDGDRMAFAACIADHFSQHPPTMALRFGPISSVDRGVRAVLRALSERGWRGVQRDDGPVFALDLPADCAALEARISRSLLKNVRYCRRKMERELGVVSCQRYELSTCAQEVIDAVETIEKASWVARKRGDVKFVGDTNRRFWTTMRSSPAASLSETVIWVLRCGTAPVAFSAHIETAETIYIIANTYDERWASHSPGSVLSFEVLRDACQRGKRKVDWGQGDSGYKARWGAVASDHLVDVMMFRPGLRGRLLNTLTRRLHPEWHEPKYE